MRLKNYGTLRLRAMLAIASFIIRDPDDLLLHTRVPGLKSRTPLAHSALATGRSIAALKSSGLIGRKSIDSLLVRPECLGRAQVHKTEAPRGFACLLSYVVVTVYKFDHSAVDGNPEAHFKCLEKLVGERGFEPPTPWSRTRCSTRLSHSPTLG